MRWKSIARSMKRLPVVGPLASWAWGRFVRRRAPFEFVRSPLHVSDPGERAQRQILNLLEYTKSSGSYYSAADHPAGYHTLTVDGMTIQGRRDPARRLELVPFEFEGATVLDLGSNQGGMLFAVADRIEWGVGVDYDPRMVNAANRLASYERVSNLDFYVFDLDAEDLAIIEDLLPGSELDIVFLLSVCMWIDRWRHVIDRCAQLAPNLLFESNGSDRQRREQYEYLIATYPSVRTLALASDDDKQQPDRQLYLCQR